MTTALHPPVPMRPKAQLRPAPRAVPTKSVDKSADKSLAKSLAKPAASRSSAAKPEPKMLFQRFFQSVGPRTYTAQIKELPNANHVLVLVEEKRDPKTDELRQSRLFIYGEDFTTFFRMLHETAGFIRENPLPAQVRKRRSEFWAKKKK